MNFNFDSRLAEQTLLKYGINYRHQEIKPQAFLNGEFKISDKEKDQRNRSRRRCSTKSKKPCK